jgi:hypothetical protein
MTVGVALGYAAIMLLLALPVPSHAAGGETFFHEDFNDLDAWRPFFFPKIKEHSEYKTESAAGVSRLVAISNSSASAMIYREDFNVYEYPLLEWRWMVGKVYEKGDARVKSGDDYPIRVYVMFRYDPGRARFGQKVKYGLAKALYGEYPPHSSLNYVWANKAHEERIISSPYTERSKMIILRQGGRQAGAWQEEHADILADYREAFGEDPPARAGIAVMNDSDNTGESSVSYIEYLRIYRQ